MADFPQNLPVFQSTVPIYNGAFVLMGMHSARYMSRRGRLFQLRVPIPKDLHHRFNRKELRWSLQTTDRNIARRRTLRASLAFVELCDTIRIMSELSNSKIKTLVQELFDALVSEHKPLSAIHPLDLDFEDDQQKAMAEDIMLSLTEQIQTRDYSEGIHTEAISRLSAKGIQFDNLGEKTKAGLLEGLTRAKIEYIRYIEHRRKTALDSYYPHDQTFTQETLQASSNFQTTQTLTSQPMPPGEGGNLADRLELYLSEGNWSSKTKNEKIGVLNWFVELVGSDMDVRLIDSSHVIKFKNAISSIRLHAKTNSSLKQAQTTIKEQQIDSKTAKKKFDTAKTFLHWLAEIGAIHNVPAPHVKMKVVAKPKSEQRRPFTADELAKLFSSPLYSGCKSGKRRYLPGKIMLRDDFFWLPLILLYSGMRLAEPLFLSTGNVIIDTPYPYMNLDLSKQKLKNAGSEREVPIHPDLIEFGFIDFVKVRQKAGLSGRLFHRITSKGDVSNYYSKYLGRYIDRIGLTDPRLVAHSFRHGFKDALRNANIPEGEQYRIMGQSPKDVGQTYGVGSDISVLWEHAAKTDLLLTDEVKELLKGKK